MGKQVVIQTNVPICPNCSGMLKLNKIMQCYLCYNCGSKFKLKEPGQTEREFVCEEKQNDKISQEKAIN